MDKTSNKNLISVSASAIEQFKKILSEEENICFVRILVDSGGCSGFSYKFSVDKNIDKDNFVVVVVGNKYSLKDKLAKFGKVQEIKLK